MQMVHMLQLQVIVPGVLTNAFMHGLEVLEGRLLYS